MKTRNEINDIIEKIMHHKKFFFSELHTNNEFNLEESEIAYRLADNAIRRWRNRGWIDFIRVKNRPYWYHTDRYYRSHPHVNRH